MDLQKFKLFLQNLIQKPIKFALYLLGAIVVVWILLGIVVFLIFRYFMGGPIVPFGLGADESSYGVARDFGMGGGVEAPMVASYQKSMISPIDGNYLSGPEPEARKIIKTGSLSLLVSSAEEAISNIKSASEKLGGFVENSNVYETTSYVRNNTSVIVKDGNVTVRIPDNKFDDAMASFKSLAIKVESESTNASDVTDQVVDIQARLKNLRAEEDQYRSILNRATEIKDVLDVTGRLADVRTRIETMQAQLDTINKRVSWSTISISLRSEADLGIVGKAWRPLSTMKAAFQNLLTGVTDFIDSLIVFIISLPVYLLYVAAWIFGLWIVWRLIKYLKAKIF